MFKVGDKVVVINNKNKKLFRIGDKFTIEELHPFDDYVRMKGEIFYYDVKCFKLDQTYYRKEKLQKLNNINVQSW